MITKYFSGTIELATRYPLPKEKVRAKYPEGKIKRFDSFDLWVGTIDGKWSETDFLPVTRVIRYNETGSGHKCNAKCRNAKGPSCECQCKGVNHGVGG